MRRWPVRRRLEREPLAGLGEDHGAPGAAHRPGTGRPPIAARAERWRRNSPSRTNRQYAAHIAKAARPSSTQRPFPRARRWPGRPRPCNGRPRHGWISGARRAGTSCSSRMMPIRPCCSARDSCKVDWRIRRCQRCDPKTTRRARNRVTQPEGQQHDDEYGQRRAQIEARLTGAALSAAHPLGNERDTKKTTRGGALGGLSLPTWTRTKKPALNSALLCHELRECCVYNSATLSKLAICQFEGGRQ